MSEEGIIDLLTFPDVPLEQRPQKIYIDYMLPSETTEKLNARGWEIIDVRVLPNATDGDRAEAVKVHLQGVRQRTILPPEGTIRHLELEARIYGLLDSKQRDQRPELTMDTDTFGVLKSMTSKFSQGKLEPKKSKRKS